MKSVMHSSRKPSKSWNNTFFLKNIIRKKKNLSEKEKFLGKKYVSLTKLSFSKESLIDAPLV